MATAEFTINEKVTQDNAAETARRIGSDIVKLIFNGNSADVLSRLKSDTLGITQPARYSLGIELWISGVGREKDAGFGDFYFKSDGNTCSVRVECQLSSMAQLDELMLQYFK